MSYQNQLISPFEIGQQTDVDPESIADNAFEKLRNMRLYRGRLKKKFGYSNLGRLRRAIGATAITQTTGVGVATDTITDLLLDGSINLRATEPNAYIVPKSVTISIAAPDAGTWNDATAEGTLTATGGKAVNGTINYGTGEIVLNYSAPVTIGGAVITVTFSYWPALPVMGLVNRELPALNFEELLAFDTKYCYLWNTVANTFGDITPTIGGTFAPWSGSDSQFFWATNYWRDTANNNLLWVTNNRPADRIRYYAGGGAGGWNAVAFEPVLNALAPGNQRLLYTCRIIVPYRNYLIALNTTEFDEAAATQTNYQSRARWSAIGDPTNVANWDDTTPGKGNYFDAPTNEAILTARFIKDTLVVGFERSTWILKFNSASSRVPFIWERVHSELGSDATFSSVIFDNFMLQVGNRGITSCNGYSTERIDLKVPFLVHNIQNDHEGSERVHGIRDYNEQMVYWTYADQQLDRGVTYPKIYPESIIAYNYFEQAFSTYDASFTCFGHYQPANDMTWAQATKINWKFPVAWNSGQTQSGFPSIVAGNQVGYVQRINSKTSNAISAFISGASIANPTVITAPNHNFQNGQCIKITGVIGATELNDKNFFITTTLPNTFVLQQLVNGALEPFAVTNTYVAGGFITPIDNVEIKTKQFSPFSKDDLKFRLGYAEFLLSNTTGGELTLNVLLDQNTSTPVNTLTLPTINPGEPPLSTPKSWQRVYTNIVGNYIQFQIKMNNTQLNDDNINTSNVEMDAFNMSIAPAGRRGSFS